MSMVGRLLMRAAGVRQPADARSEAEAAAGNPLDLDEDLFAAGSAESAVDAAASRALIVEFERRVEELEQARAAERASFERTIEELKSALEREQTERTMADGALEKALQDFAGLLRELMELQRARHAAGGPAALQPADAA